MDSKRRRHLNEMGRVGLFTGSLGLFLIVTACIAATPDPEIVLVSSPVLTVIEAATSTPAPTETHTLSLAPTASDTPTPPLPTPDTQRPSETMTSTPTPTWTYMPIPTPTASATPLPPSPTPCIQPPSGTETPTPFVPTLTPSAESEGETALAGFRYLPVGPAKPALSQPCPGCPRAPGYIAGRVVDASGNPLAGVRLVCYNDWHRYPIVGSKGGGEYDFPILQAEATWHVTVLDESNQPLSPEVPVYFNPLEACWYRLDWQRTD